MRLLRGSWWNPLGKPAGQHVDETRPWAGMFQQEQVYLLLRFGFLGLWERELGVAQIGSGHCHLHHLA